MPSGGTFPALRVVVALASSPTERGSLQSALVLYHNQYRSAASAHYQPSYSVRSRIFASIHAVQNGDGMVAHELRSNSQHCFSGECSSSHVACSSTVSEFCLLLDAWSRAAFPVLLVDRESTFVGEDGEAKKADRKDLKISSGTKYRGA